MSICMCICVTSLGGSSSSLIIVFLLLSNLLEGGRSSCRWWFKVPHAPNCHPTVCERHLWMPGTGLQLPVAVTACRGPGRDWCQLDNWSLDCFWVNQSVMHTADYIFLLFHSMRALTSCLPTRGWVCSLVNRTWCSWSRKDHIWLVIARWIQIQRLIAQWLPLTCRLVDW